jgi:hypothetical protein
MSTITTEMAHAGYAALKKLASDEGYGWEFNMIPESKVEGAMDTIATAMLAAAPAGWTPGPAVVAAKASGTVRAAKANEGGALANEDEEDA